MKKIERLYCIIVGMNLALLVLALIMNLDLESVQTQHYIGLSLALSILTSIGSTRKSGKKECVLA